MITVEAALAALQRKAVPGKGAEMAAYHKVDRVYLGVANPEIDALAKAWRTELTVEQRIALAQGLWDSDIHEARVAAAKLFTQARIRPDDAVWRTISGWVPQFDAWAVADHASIAGQKRLVADPTRLDEVETWTRSDHLWTKRAALVMTLPWTKQNTPNPPRRPPATVSSAGRRAMSTTLSGSSKRRSPGGCASCPNMTGRAPRRFWTGMAHR